MSDHRGCSIESQLSTEENVSGRQLLHLAEKANILMVYGSVADSEVRNLSVSVGCYGPLNLKFLQSLKITG